MSMNVFITGKRRITVDKTGEKDTQTIVFNALQTRTDTTNLIISSENPIQKYREWVMEWIPKYQEKIPVYGDQDFLCEEEPIGYEDYNSMEEHLNEFDEWLKMCEKKGYDVFISMI